MIFVDAQQNHTNGIQLNSNVTFSTVVHYCTVVLLCSYIRLCRLAYLATPQYFVQTTAVNSSFAFQIHDRRPLYRISKEIIAYVTSKRHRREGYVL